MRPSGRQTDELRKVTITRNYTCHAEGSVLIEFGNTKVICTASFDSGVPRFLKRHGRWLGDCGIRHVTSVDRFTHAT